MKRLSPIPEVFAYTAVAAAITGAITLATRVVSFGSILGVGVPLTFLVLAVRAANRSGGPARHGFSLGGVIQGKEDEEAPLWRTIYDAFPSAVREIGVAVLVAAVIFPPFVAAFYFWNEPSHAFAWRWPGGGALAFAETAATHLLVVALTEEAFFRGYVQTRLHDAWPPSIRILGAHLNLKVWVLQSLLFALVHLIDQPHPRVLAVFFPGLLFGWLRAWRGGIGAALVFHGLSNILSEILYSGWMRA